MRIPFWKMHGAGNDFVLVDDRDRSFPVTDTSWMANLSRRRTGVGCEGIILIQPSMTADFRMRFINPDGTEVGMCGNGLRCVARLAFELNIAPATMRIETRAGLMRAECMDSDVRVWFPPPSGAGCSGEIDVEGRRVPYCLIDTGVPHAVVHIEKLAGVRDPVAELGRAIRMHDRFAPEGTNVDFISCPGGNALSVRTYERGVEDETLACGTGVVAGALVAGREGLVSSPVDVSTAGGSTLTVDFVVTADGFSEVALTGPVKHVYEGSIEFGA